MVMEVVQEDIEEDSMQCAIHPSKNNTPGAICAFCLQEKLGNLVSSAFSVAVFLSSPSPPPSPSSKPAINVTSTTATTTTEAATTLTSSAIRLHRSASTHSNQIFTRRATLPFLLVQRMNKKKTKDGDVSIRRCNSTTTPRHDQRECSRAKKRGFWSFLYPTSSSSSKHTIAKKNDKTCKDAGVIITSASSTNMRNGASGSSKEWKTEDNMEVEKHGISSDKVASGRKVSRSRSVGCGSKSFSGDFFGRISTGLGDCTLRRVESQREGKAKNKMHRNGGDNNGQDCIKERVKCGRIFGSFLINHASSSSSSFEDQTLNRRTTSNVGHHNNQIRAFATPIRFFSTKYSNGIGAAQSNNVAPNLLAVGS
ncbi:hypothetical protein LIER_06940 [Lithospermum erythrorhizon]|uniref:Uncharacterized protein n=1 Tax=Lithospermum erythrorhizon TaxID=34254 RepID=A0AAV3P6F2_LITER